MISGHVTEYPHVRGGFFGFFALIFSPIYGIEQI